MKRRVRKFKIGLKQIIVEILTGLLTTFILAFLTRQGWLPYYVRLGINIFLIIGNILLIRKMWSWGLFYTRGWVIGSVVFFKLGMLNTWEIVLYIVLPVLALLARTVVTVKRAIAA